MVSVRKKRPVVSSLQTWCFISCVGNSPQSDVVDIVPDLGWLLPKLQGARLNNGFHSFVSIVHQDVQASVLLILNSLEQLIDLIIVLVIHLNRDTFTAAVSYLEDQKTELW